MHADNGSGGELWTDVTSQMVKRVSCTTDVNNPNQQVFWISTDLTGLTINLTTQTVHVQYMAGGGVGVATKTFFITLMGPDAHERQIQVDTILASEVLTSPPAGWPQPPPPPQFDENGCPIS